MFDGSIKDELLEKDQVDCKGILTETYFDSLDELYETVDRINKIKDLCLNLTDARIVTKE